MIYDISVSLDKDTVIYPNDPSFSREEFVGGTSFISKLTFGSHTGTHLDVPKHVFSDGVSVDKIDLEKITGKCRVLDMTKLNFGDAVRVSDLEKENIKEGERILVKTKNSERGFKIFYADYIYLDGDAADFLVEKKIAMFGIDYLSVKQKGSKDLRPHTSLLGNGICIFETLDLSQVIPGEYFFVGLPLKITEADGSPVRAILIEM